MVALQIISKVLQSSDLSIIRDNGLTEEHFCEYQDEFHFIMNHFTRYNNVPDKETFLATFPEFELLEVSESDRYLLETIQEEYMYRRTVPILQKVADLTKDDSNAAVEYMRLQLQNLQPVSRVKGTSIIKQAKLRLDEYIDKRDNQKNWYLESGFKELDDITHGLKRGEELLVIVARTNQGKSWVLAKICTHIWQTGYNVGYFSPEMGVSSIGYRFDTLNAHFSNRDLAWGRNFNDYDTYDAYIDELATKTNDFEVITPKEFKKFGINDGRVTVSALRQWIVSSKLDMVAIDGITYLSDERGKRNDNKTTSLTNISEDLMNLSVELGVPIAVVVQSNRNGVMATNQADNDETPDLDSIRDSDGIAHNASQVISIKQKQDNVLVMSIKKQRNGAVGGKLNYTWNIDTGEFVYIPSYDDARPHADTEAKVTETKKQYKDRKDVF